MPCGEAQAGTNALVRAGAIPVLLSSVPLPVARDSDRRARDGDRLPKNPVSRVLALESRNPGDRPKVDREVRNLIRRMRDENSFWGTPRTHVELLKLGSTIAQSTVPKCLLR
jgi:hypothetical protein